MIFKTIVTLVFSLCVAGGGVLAADSVGGERQLGVQLEVKNPMVLMGEPIQLRTTLVNSWRQPAQSQLAYSWRHGFDIEVAAGEQPKFHSIFSSEAVSLLNPSRPPIVDDYWEDRQIFLGPLPAGANMTRVDMLVFPRAKPGTYRIRAVLTDIDECRHESNPVTIKIMSPKDAKDPIADLCDQPTLIRIGEAICEVHWQSFSDDKEMRKKTFDQWVTRIIADPAGKRLREPALYTAFALSWSAAVEYTSYRCPDEEQMKAAEQFLKEYPDSWLLPHVYAMLFDAYNKQGKADKAEEIRRKAVKAFPQAAVLRTLHGSTAAKRTTTAPGAAPSTP